MAWASSPTCAPTCGTRRYSANAVTLDQVDKISSSRKFSTVELGLGLVARVSLYVSADYSSDVDDNDLNGIIGSLGVRMRW